VCVGAQTVQKSEKRKKKKQKRKRKRRGKETKRKSGNTIQALRHW
jgi:hypothetical protein